MKETQRHRDEREAQAAEIAQESKDIPPPTPPPDDVAPPAPPPAPAVSDHERIARVCHVANRALAATLGDTSFKPWTDESDEERASAVADVRFVLEHPDASAEALHGDWVGRKLTDGWRKGASRDPARKVDHRLVPFFELGRARAAEEITCAIVRALAEEGSR
jgi:hypothetical protein